AYPSTTFPERQARVQPRGLARRGNDTTNGRAGCRERDPAADARRAIDAAKLNDEQRRRRKRLEAWIDERVQGWARRRRRRNPRLDDPHFEQALSRLPALDLDETQGRKPRIRGLAERETG